MKNKADLMNSISEFFNNDKNWKNNLNILFANAKEFKTEEINESEFYYKDFLNFRYINTENSGNFMHSANHNNGDFIINYNYNDFETPYLSSNSTSIYSGNSVTYNLRDNVYTTHYVTNNDNKSFLEKYLPYKTIKPCFEKFCSKILNKEINFDSEEINNGNLNIVTRNCSSDNFIYDMYLDSLKQQIMAENDKFKRFLTKIEDKGNRFISLFYVYLNLLLNSNKNIVIKINEKYENVLASNEFKEVLNLKKLVPENKVLLVIKSKDEKIIENFKDSIFSINKENIIKIDV